MSRTSLRSNRKMRAGLYCPGCYSAIHFRFERGVFGACPHCGEWLVRRGLLNQRVERFSFEYEPELPLEADEAYVWKNQLA